MKQSRKPDGDFEQRLLEKLKAVVNERRAAQATASEATAPAPAWRRTPRLALGAIAVLAVAAAVLLFSSDGNNAPKALAVEPQQGGGVTIKVYSLEDAADLEKALEDAGIKAQVTWLPAGMTCPESHFTPSKVKTSLGGTIGGSTVGMTIAGTGPAMTIGVMSPQQYRKRWREYRRGEISAGEYRESSPNISLDPSSFRPDQSVVIHGSPRPSDGGYEAQFAIAAGPVPPCRPVPAPAATIGSIELPQGGGSEAPAAALPTPGQFLYTKTKVVELQGWEPDGRGAGPKAKPRRFTANLLGAEGNALPALVPTAKEVWTAPDGKTRVREALGRIEFLSGDDQRRWEDAGSPPPFAYDPSEHQVRSDDSGRPLKEYASQNWRGRRVFSSVPKLYRLPTEPEALRLAIERPPSGDSPVPAQSHRGSVTAETLMEILSEPIISSALRAAALEALAEIPGIGLRHGVADVAGRRGDALTWVRERGFGRELIFDPRTSELLAQAEMIFGPPSTSEYGVPARTVFRETAYLRSGIVDSSNGRAVISPRRAPPSPLGGR